MMSCTDCPSRRDFLQIVAALGLAALPVLFVDGVEAAGAQKYPFPAADSVTIDRKQQVIIVRAQGHVYAFNLSCPHENTALKWLPKDNRFQCPKHQSTGTSRTARSCRAARRGTWTASPSGAKATTSTSTSHTSSSRTPTGLPGTPRPSPCEPLAWRLAAYPPA
jgi:nitrite reductase/ring-hydroxylating ferredoxin subunit